MTEEYRVPPGTTCCFCGRDLGAGGNSSFRFRDPRDGKEKTRCLSNPECSGWFWPLVFEDPEGGERR